MSLRIFAQGPAPFLRVPFPNRGTGERWMQEQETRSENGSVNAEAMV